MAGSKDKAKAQSLLRVSFLSSGGFAGLRRGAEVSEANLGDKELAQLRNLLAKVSPGAEKLDPSRITRPDVRQYRIDILERGSSKALEFSDSDLSEPLGKLVAFLNERAKPVPYIDSGRARPGEEKEMPKTQQNYRVTRTTRIQIADLQGAAREAWEQMREPGTIAHANALAHGIDLQALPPNVSDALEVRSDGAGVGTVDAAVVIFLSKVAWDAWKHVVLPHIRMRWGDRAIVAKEKAKAAKRAVAKKSAPAPRKKSRAKARKK